MVDRRNHEFPSTSGHTTTCWVYLQCVRAPLREISDQQWYGEDRVTLEKSETSAWKSFFSSHRQSSEGIQFITPTELLPTSSVCTAQQFLTNDGRSAVVRSLVTLWRMKENSALLASVGHFSSHLRLEVRG